MSTEITSKRDTGKDGEVKQQYINTMCTYIRLLRFECVADISAGEFYFKYFWAKRYKIMSKSIDLTLICNKSMLKRTT